MMWRNGSRKGVGGFARRAIVALVVLTAMTMGLAPVAPVAADGHDGAGILSECTWNQPDRGGCTAPPSDMVAWWPLDEVAGAVLAHDKIGENHGIPEGTPYEVPGAVANARAFDHEDDLIRMPHDASLNPGTGDLSIDSWVLSRGFEGSGTILEKLGTVTVRVRVPESWIYPYDPSEEFQEGLGFPVDEFTGGVLGPVEEFAHDQKPGLLRIVERVVLQGYHFFIEHGVLMFEMTVAGQTSRFDSGYYVGDWGWHFIAVSVDRDNPEGGIFYVDGVPVAFFDPTERQGSLDNAADATMGRLSAPADRPWMALDEVELFHRVLGEDEVARLWDAGENGKCKIDCANPTFHSLGVTHGAEGRPDFEAGISYRYRRDVGQQGANKAFLHTFQNLPDEIISATLKIHVVSQGSSLDYNDAMHIQYDALTNKFDWGRHIGSWSTKVGLTSHHWGNGLSKVFVFDLAALPEADGSFVDVVGSMNANGYLDVFVQDDTSVEFLELSLVTCACEDQPADIVISAGVKDDFNANANTPEVATPGPGLSDKTGECSRPTVSFDETSNDRCFGHTFTFEPQCLDFATLEMRIKSFGGLALNDGMGLAYDTAQSRFTWYSSFANILGSYGSHGQVVTVTLDIGTVSPAVLDSMRLTGTLDVYVQDDTAVDYITLSMKSCCDCENAPPTVLSVGAEDDFDGSQGTEIATPGPGLAAYNANCSRGPTGFDETRADRCFAHTFTFGPQCIDHAVLEIRLKGLHPLAHNDAIALGHDPSAAGSFHYRSALKNLPEAGGAWAAGETATFFIDIAAGSPALLLHMEQTGSLDIQVGDDTSVDYVRLHLKACCGDGGIQGPTGLLEHLVKVGTAVVDDVDGEGIFIVPGQDTPEEPAWGAHSLWYSAPAGTPMAVCSQNCMGNEGLNLGGVVLPASPSGHARVQVSDDLYGSSAGIIVCQDLDGNSYCSSSEIVASGCGSVEIVGALSPDHPIVVAIPTMLPDLQTGGFCGGHSGEVRADYF